ncbi:hypothetical protein F4818DRAFT_436423 [Hypoxylon cercidicola]|nr:hypothetical protein F4818DRAFT_436423 [Hypoxylon cercidicola]
MSSLEPGRVPPAEELSFCTMCKKYKPIGLFTQKRTRAVTKTCQPCRDNSNNNRQRRKRAERLFQQATAEAGEAAAGAAPLAPASRAPASLALAPVAAGATGANATGASPTSASSTDASSGPVGGSGPQSKPIRPGPRPRPSTPASPQQQAPRRSRLARILPRPRGPEPMFPNYPWLGRGPVAAPAHGDLPSPPQDTSLGAPMPLRRQTTQYRLPAVPETGYTGLPRGNGGVPTTSAQPAWTPQPSAFEHGYTGLGSGGVMSPSVQPAQIPVPPFSDTGYTGLPRVNRCISSTGVQPVPNPEPNTFDIGYTGFLGGNNYNPSPIPRPAQNPQPSPLAIGYTGFDNRGVPSPNAQLAQTYLPSTPEVGYTGFSGVNSGVPSPNAQLGQTHPPSIPEVGYTGFSGVNSGVPSPSAQPAQPGVTSPPQIVSEQDHQGGLGTRLYQSAYPRQVGHLRYDTQPRQDTDAQLHRNAQFHQDAMPWLRPRPHVAGPAYMDPQLMLPSLPHRAGDDGDGGDDHDPVSDPHTEP